jgi:cytidine deaminase
MQLSIQETERIRLAALSARKRAYAPYSHFLVGAAILCDDGRIIEGCNVENASYGLTLCAERAAVAAAVAAGVRRWKSIAIASAGAVTPCGACRQVLHEFGDHAQVVLIDAATEAIKQTCSVADLLPGAFDLNGNTASS